MKYHSKVGLASVVGIATGYGLDVRGSNPGGGQDFPHLSRWTPEPIQRPVQGVPGLSRGKKRPERDADPSSASSFVVMKE
jgi:hypothetical protein